MLPLRPSRRRPLTVVVVLLVAVMLATGLLLSSGSPVLAVARQTLVEPEAGMVVSGPFAIVALVSPDDGEVIDGVDARLTGASERQLPLAATQEEPLEDGSQRWSAQLDPLDGLPLANGRYLVEVQARPLVGDPATWVGHEVDLRVPPPTRELGAEPAAQDATQVLLSWDSVALPDFTAYRLQRRPDADDGAWQTVLEITDPRQGRATDQVEQPGTFRYRLVVVRANGDGGEILATSDPRGVRADPEDPGTFSPPRDPDPEPSPSQAPQPGVRPLTRPTDSPDGPGPTDQEPPTQSSGQPQTGTGSGLPPRIRVPSQPAPAAPPPAVPFNDGVFEPLLPVDQDIPERITVTETETAMVGGGMTPGGTLDTIETQRGDRPLLTALAGGLLLVVSSAHVRRYVAGASSR